MSDIAAITKATSQTKAVKVALRDLIETVIEIGIINEDAGRYDAADAAMDFRGDLHLILGKVDKAHARVSKALKSHLDDGAIKALRTGIQTRGPGGR